MEVVLFLAAMRTSFSLRSLDEYDLLQIFLQETVSHEIDTLLYGFDLAELS